MELITGLQTLSFWEIFADMHGLLGMLSLILFGASIILYYISAANVNLVNWLKKGLFILFLNLTLLDIAGLTVYVPYRAEGGPRTTLKASPATSWIHTIVFEHKEFLAFAPPMIILTAYLVTRTLGSKFNDQTNSYLKKSIIFSLIISLIFTLVVAGEAVMVTKAAPVF